MNPRNNGLYQLTAENKLRYAFHRGQWEAWQAAEQEILILAGTQGGKTSFLPVWLHREMQTVGPGDYLVVTPTFPLLDKKALPEFKTLLEDYLQLGRYVGSPSRRFEVSKAGQQRLWGDSGRDYRTTIWFGYASEPDSLESMTAKAAVLDEMGQQVFKRESYEAIRRRLTINRGRLLGATTPYYWGWVKEKYDTAASDPDLRIVHFESIMNPAFPREEWDRARRDMPPWRFDMFYRARFTRPAGLIYDSFDQDTMVCAPFVVPADWPRYRGGDFGGINTAMVYIAERPQDGHLFLYREYHAGNRTAADHAEVMNAGEPADFEAFGGAKSEQQWRDEFTRAGLRIREPLISDVEVGINRVYALFASGRLTVFDTCSETLDELETYSRVTDEAGEPLEGIADKNKFHLLDALRYVATYLNQDLGEPASGWVEGYSSSRERIGF